MGFASYGALVSHFACLPFICGLRSVYIHRKTGSVRNVEHASLCNTSTTLAMIRIIHGSSVPNAHAEDFDLGLCGCSLHLGTHNLILVLCTPYHPLRMEYFIPICLKLFLEKLVHSSALRSSFLCG